MKEIISLLLTTKSALILIKCNFLSPFCYLPPLSSICKFLCFFPFSCFTPAFSYLSESKRYWLIFLWKSTLLKVTSSDSIIQTKRKCLHLPASLKVFLILLKNVWKHKKHFIHSNILFEYQLSRKMSSYTTFKNFFLMHGFLNL